MVPKKRTKKSTQKTFVNKKPGAKKGKGNDEDEEDDFNYHCDKCSQKFTDWKLQAHKLDCVKVPQKFMCSKCNRGIQQKTIMEQHFDFYHTKNPRSMFAMNTTNAMCTRNHMMNTSEEITLMAITDLCVTIVVRASSTKVNSEKRLCM